MIYVLSNGNVIKLLLCHHADAVGRHPKSIAGFVHSVRYSTSFSCKGAKKKNKRGCEFLCAFAIS